MLHYFLWERRPVVQRKPISALATGIFLAVASAPLVSTTLAEAHDATQPELTQKLIAKTTNEVGCVMTAITWPHKPKTEGSLTSLFYSRPSTLNAERLSDYELRTCGLQPQRKVRHLPKNSLEYQAWLTRASKDIAGKPAPIPAGNAVYHERDPRYHWPDPPEPSGSH